MTLKQYRLFALLIALFSAWGLTANAERFNLDEGSDIARHVGQLIRSPGGSQVFRTLEAFCKSKNAGPFESYGSANGVRYIECQETDDGLRYSIDLMWLNGDYNHGQQYIHFAHREDDLVKQFLGKIFLWVDLNPHAKVNVWYDGETTSKEAVERTKEVVTKHVHLNPKYADIRFRDVQELNIIRDNGWLLYPRRGDVPVIFRADLYRLMTAVQSLKDSDEFVVYMDLRGSPMKKADIFDKETLAMAREHGFVVAHESRGHFGYENSFHIACGSNPNTVEAIEQGLIHLNLRRLRNHHEGSFSKTRGEKWHEEIVWASYPGFFSYLFHVNGKLRMPELMLREEPLKLSQSMGGPFSTRTDDQVIWIRREPHKNAPTKVVPVPPSSRF